MSEPTFTDEQLDTIIDAVYTWNSNRGWVRDFIRAVLAAALARGVVALPPAKVEDARVQAAIENLKCWAEEWDETGMNHEAALCRQMAETVERLAAERKPESTSPLQTLITCGACGQPYVSIPRLGIHHLCSSATGRR